MERIRNGALKVPYQVTLVAGMLLMIPALKVPGRTPGVELVPGSTEIVIGAVATEPQEVVLAEIVNEHHTYLREDLKSALPALIVEVSARYGYDPLFVAGLIEVESSFNNQAVSTAGARGLLQVVPFVGQSVAEEIGIAWTGADSLYDPEINLDVGLFYLRQLEERYGSLDLALAAYNMGPSLLDEKMADGFKPRGVYAAKIKGAFKQFRTRLALRQSPVLASAGL